MDKWRNRQILENWLSSSTIGATVLADSIYIYVIGAYQACAHNKHNWRYCGARLIDTPLIHSRAHIGCCATCVYWPSIYPGIQDRIEAHGEGLKATRHYSTFRVTVCRNQLNMRKCSLAKIKIYVLYTFFLDNEI